MSSIMREDWIECTFEDLLDYEQPTKYIVRSTKYSDDYKTPVLTAGKSFIKGYTNETDGIFDELPTIIFDDFTTATQFVDFAFKVKSSAMKILVPTSKLVNMKFVFNCIQVNQVRNDTHKRYWISLYAKKKILLPPLVEQRAILEKTEALFSDLDNGIANFKKAQEQLKIYRQAVLKKAFEGELTKVLFNDWEYSTLKESVKFSQGIQVDVNLQSENKSNNSVRFLRIIDFTQGIDPARYIENPGEKYIVRKDDVSLVRYGASTGFVCSNLEGAIANNLFRIIPVKPIDKKYLYYFLCSPLFQNIISQSVKGAAMPAISFGLINDVVLPFPKNISDQAQIVQEIESRLSVCDNMEQSISESLEKAEALRQSILKKAFEGKLLSQAEIAQCKQAADYEPASELLKKIQAEKSAILRQAQDAKKKKPSVKKKIPKG